MPVPDVTILSAETVWKARTRLDVVKFRNRRFDGAMSDIRTWEVWLRGHSVGVLPYDPVRDVLVMIEQFRYPAMVAGLDPILLEVPGGFTDDAETEAETGAREMHEEMGLEAERLHRIGRFVLTAGGSDESVTLMAGKVTAPEAGPDGIAGYAGLASESEDIRIRVISAQQAIEDALAGRYANAITMMALSWFAAKRDWLRTEWTA